MGCLRSSQRTLKESSTQRKLKNMEKTVWKNILAWSTFSSWGNQAILYSHIDTNISIVDLNPWT